MMSNVRMITSAKRATKQDLYVTLAYVQDTLDAARKLKEKIDSMPLLVRAALEERGDDLEMAAKVEVMCRFSRNYVEHMIELY